VKLAVDRLSAEATASALPSDPLRQSLSFAPSSPVIPPVSNVAAAQKLIGLNENDGLQGKLRSRCMRWCCSRLDQPRLAVLMLMMRRHEKDFCCATTKYGNWQARRVSAELAKSDLPETSGGDRQAGAELQGGFSLSWPVGQLTEEADDLAQIYDRLRPAMTAVRKSADQRLEAVKAELAGVRSLVFWSICITVLVMLAAALLFGRWLTRPLVKMVEAMEHLANGYLDRAIERVDRRDEIGKMSGAIFQGTVGEPAIRRRSEEAKRAARSSVDRPCSRWRVSSRRSAESWKRIGGVSEIEVVAGA
jgi:methyl-accepting chemotaxis protein